MTARLLENNEHFSLLSGKGKLGFLGLGDQAEAARVAANLAEAQVKYPFPPKGCADAELKIGQLEADIQVQQKILATNGGDRVAKRWAAAFLNVQNDFKQWVLAAQCDQQEAAASDADFYNQVNSAIGAQTASGDSKKTVDNWIIYGVLGVLGIGAMIIILKK